MVILDRSVAATNTATGVIQEGASLITYQRWEIVNLSPAPDVYQKSPMMIPAGFLGQVGEGIDSDRLFAESLSSTIETRLSARILSFDQDTLKELDKTNQRLAKEGKPPVDIVSVTKEIEAITNNSNLSDKEKRGKINEIRKRLGLSKGEMKKLFTKRLEKIYKEAKEELERNINSLRTDVAQAERIYGKDSPQAIMATRRLETVERVNQPLLQRLDQNQKLYNSMYKPGGCIKKMFKGIGGFFKGLAKTAFNTLKGIINPRNWFKPAFWKNIVLPLALNFIPGIGPLVSTAYQWANRIYQGVRGVMALAQGKLGEALSYGMGALGGLTSKISEGLSSVSETLTRWVEKGWDYYRRGQEIYRAITSWPETWLEEKWNRLFYKE